MPAYAFDFVTPSGTAERLQFTLDDDRPLAPQLNQVLEELRQRGLVVRGGPGDELGAFWEGTDLDQARTPQELGVSPRRPIELRMRPAPRKAPPRPPEPPPTRFRAKGGVAAAVAGFSGALVAWVAAGSFSDLGPVVDDYAQLDGVVAVLFGVLVGIAALASQALREARSLIRAIPLGAALGLLGGIVGALASGLLRSALGEVSSPGAFVAARVAAWAVLGGALGASLALPAVRRDARRVLEGLIVGLAAGAFAGLVYGFPGASDVWQLVGFVLLGAAVAWGACAPALQRSAAILERAPAGRGPPGVLALREWGLDERTGVSLERGDTRARVEWTNGRFAIVPAPENGEPVVVSGQPVGTAIYLRNGDVIEVGGERYLFRRMRGAAAVALLAAMSAGAHAQDPAVGEATAVGAARAPGIAAVVRCAPGVDLPCVVGTVDLGTEELRLLARHDTLDPSRMWTGRLGGADLVGPTVRASRASSRPFVLLVLVDVSGSMRGEGMAFVRSSLRAFLRELPADVRVAVAPFESRAVAARIAEARFGSSADAIAALEALPPPDAAGNTALFSAVREGVVSLDRAVRAAPPGARGGLLVITDGRNDVAGRRDDPGLLSGVAGRRAASEAAERSGHAFWIVGAGGVDAAELRALAGARGQPYIIALSPGLLAQSLTGVAQQIGTVRELTFGLSTGSRLRLARARAPAVVRFRAVDGSGAGFTRTLAWRPPLFALPAFEGVADSASLPSEVRAVMGFAGSDSSRRWLLALFFGLLGVVAAGVYPRIAWAERAPASAAAKAGPATVGDASAREAGRGAAGGGLRRDVQEAPPRAPDEITGSFARVEPPPT